MIYPSQLRTLLGNVQGSLGEFRRKTCHSGPYNDTWRGPKGFGKSPKQGQQGMLQNLNRLWKNTGPPLQAEAPGSDCRGIAVAISEPEKERAFQPWLYHIFWDIKYDQTCFGAVTRNDQKKWARPYDQKNLSIWSHRYVTMYINYLYFFWIGFYFSTLI